MTPYDFALLAQEAYQAKPDIGTGLTASCCIVRDVADGRVIAFPGTDSVADLLTDFSVDTQVPPLIGPLHGGFWQAYAVIKQRIIEATAGADNVIFVGHSLGAALAEVAAADYIANGNNFVSAVYAFAPPKISPTNQIACILRGTPIFQYRNGNDIVPTVPPAWYHATSAFDSIGTPAWPFLNLADHKLDRYISALQNGYPVPH